MDEISEQRLADVYPPLAALVRKMAETLAAEGIYIRVVQGLRTIAEQDALYAQGRTAPGEIVTNVKGGESFHNFGMAVDCVPSKGSVGDPYEPDWDVTHPAWARMVDVGVNLGLDAGANWVHFKDHPHFQLTGKWPENEPPGVAIALAEDGLGKVWEEAFSDG